MQAMHVQHIYKLIMHKIVLDIKLLNIINIRIQNRKLRTHIGKCKDNKFNVFYSILAITHSIRHRVCKLELLIRVGSALTSISAYAARHSCELLFLHPLCRKDMS